MNVTPPTILFRTEAAAQYIQLSRSTLEKMRCNGKGPKYLKVGGRVLYRQSDLEQYLANCVVNTPGQSN